MKRWLRAQILMFRDQDPINRKHRKFMQISPLNLVQKKDKVWQYEVRTKSLHQMHTLEMQRVAFFFQLQRLDSELLQEQSVRETFQFRGQEPIP
jgi:hypothetical protein